MRYGSQEWVSSPFSVQARLKRLLQEAGRHFGIPEAAERGRLRRARDGRVLPPNIRVLDAGLAEWEVLLVEIRG